MAKDRLTLTKALKTGRLEAFVSEQEMANPAGADAKTFTKTMKAAVKPQQSKRQTSRSPSSDGSRGKRTR